MQDRLSDNAQRILDLAHFEAHRLNCVFVATEHILLGMLYMHSCHGACILKRFNIISNKVRLRIEQIAEWDRWELNRPPPAKLPQTPRIRKVIEYAMDEARKLHQDMVGSEHLLLGILREEDGVAAVVLREFGLRLQDVRNVLGSPPEAQHVQPSEEEVLASLPEEVWQEVHELDAQIVQLTMQKQEAVETWNFEMAADLRNQMDILRKRRRELLREQDRK